MIRILLQTTIQAVEDDWNIGRYSLLRDYLSSFADERGSPVFAVTARDRAPDASGHDPVLSALADSDFDEIWLFAADAGDGLSGSDCAGISAFRRRGGAILAARDHQDAGASLCTLAGVGAAHYFHSRNLDPDPSRNCVDDTETKTISWPNYHSGRNGDYQRVIAAEPVHELLRRSSSPGELIEYFPAHPHEGGIGAPEGEPYARVIATGRSKITGRPFNLIVAFEGGKGEDGKPIGRALAHASFHHFADYNWEIDKGCPSFVDEEPGDGMKREPRALADIHDYVRNAAFWLADEGWR
jgi:hypothetical protein